jgi:hypothetical protein
MSDNKPTVGEVFTNHANPSKNDAVWQSGDKWLGCENPAFVEKSLVFHRVLTAEEIAEYSVLLAEM